MDFDDIETASEEKDLGVTFQQDKFSSHNVEKVNKATCNSTHIILNSKNFWLPWERLLYSPIQIPC